MARTGAAVERSVKIAQEEILGLITAGPVRYKDIVPVWDKPGRAKLRRIFDDLLASGAIKQVYIDRFPHYVLTTWTRTDDEVMAALEGRARRTLDGCLLWTEYIDELVGPITSMDTKNGRQTVWRVMWNIKHGKLGYRDTIKTKCDNSACIEWTHLRKTTRAEVLKGRAKTPMHAMRIARAAQANAKKLDWDKVRAIRASDENADVWAERLGVSKPLITAVRRNEVWKERDTGLFSGLINERRA